MAPQPQRNDGSILEVISKLGELTGRLDHFIGMYERDYGERKTVEGNLDQRVAAVEKIVWKAVGAAIAMSVLINVIGVVAQVWVAAE